MTKIEVIKELKNIQANNYTLAPDEVFNVAIYAILDKNEKSNWIKNDNDTYSCKHCHSWIPEEQHHYAKYCLYCGARMEDVK